MNNNQDSSTIPLASELTDSELRATIYFAVGVTSESRYAAHQLAVTGDNLLTMIFKIFNCRCLMKILLIYRVFMHKRFIVPLTLFAGFMLSACVYAQKNVNRDSSSAEPEIIYMISMIQLIANPDKYEGKHVQLVGYMHLEFEGDRICLHKEDSDKAILHNCLSMGNLDKTAKLNKKSLRSFSDKYVIVEGVYNRDEDEIYAFDSGELTNIRRVEIWETFKGKNN